MRSAFNTALRLRLSRVCDCLLLRDVQCVCPLSVSEAMVLCGEQPLSVLIAHIPALALSSPELYEVVCTAVAACRFNATIALLLRTLLSMEIEECSHGGVKEWDLLRLAICSCNMAAVTVIHGWAAVGGDAKPDASILRSVVAAGKGEQTRETLQWLLAAHLSCFSHIDMLRAAETAAFGCDTQLLKLLLPHVPASPQTNNLRIVCEQPQQQQQPGALMWLALQGVK